MLTIWMLAGNMSWNTKATEKVHKKRYFIETFSFSSGSWWLQKIPKYEAEQGAAGSKGTAAIPGISAISGITSLLGAAVSLNCYLLHGIKSVSFVINMNGCEIQDFAEHW